MIDDIVMVNEGIRLHALFQIHPLTGVVSTRQAVDYDTLPLGQKYVDVTISATSAIAISWELIYQHY